MGCKEDIVLHSKSCEVCQKQRLLRKQDVGINSNPGVSEKEQLGHSKMRSQADVRPSEKYAFRKTAFFSDSRGDCAKTPDGLSGKTLTHQLNVMSTNGKTLDTSSNKPTSSSQPSGVKFILPV